MLLEEAHLLLGGELPSDWSGSSLTRLQQLALHWQLSTGTTGGTGTATATATVGGGGGQRQEEVLEEDVRNWLELALEVPREDLYSRQQAPRPERREKQIKVPSTPYEQWLSIALAQLHIPHVAGMRISKIHRAAIAFPRQKQLVDVLDQVDLSAPSFRVLGSAELRRRQFAQLGWAVHPADLRDLHHAMRSGTLKLLVSKMLRSLDPDAARRTYRTDARPGNFGGIRILSRPPKELLDSDDEGDDDPTTADEKFAHGSKTSGKASGGSGGWKSPLSPPLKSPRSGKVDIKQKKNQDTSREEPLVARSPRQELHMRAKRAAARAAAELDETAGGKV